ncbi:uncharacterized protein LOC122130410 [Clupea harengus]|uniref:Uncharacterized protein LOC122130410 n=1 Tax=Clupea harengus TaxID=7950 RepID=A0A8M1KGX7_CLUHA|nr:uncharacterized protein LOC122130410 [Clupea harengus]
MPSPHVPLLRRPLPPKKLSPLEPRASPLLSVSASQQESEEHEKRGSRCLTPGASWGSAVTLPPARPQPTPVLPAADPPPCQPIMFPPFPCRPPRTLPTMPLLHLLLEQPRYAPPPPQFLLNDFLLQLGHSRAHQRLSRRRVSVYPYRKLLEHFLFDLHSSKQTEVANQILSSEQIPPTKCRVPQRQMLCELQAFIHMEYQVQSLRSVCVCEHTSLEEWPPQDSPDSSVTHYLGSEVILNSVTTKHFQGGRRTHSPFEPTGGWGGVSPSQLAILDCLNQGGTDLNLKAHFISQLPDLSLLADTLVYLNLSFNNLSEFPLELCSLQSLQKLKLRDNPLLLLPAEIHRLTSLNTLVLSFCKLDHLPSE